MRRDTLLALVLFALGLWHNLAAIDGTEFHRDEARWIHRARFLDQLRDPLGTYWHDRDLMRGQPPLGSILMGVGLAAQGRDLETNGLWNFSKDDAWNRWHGRMPVRADLLAARRTDSVVGALTIVVAFFLGRRLVNRVAGVAAALLLIPHPLSVYLSSLAGSDALLTLLVALAALVAVALADRPSAWRAALLGVLLGLGGATKLSPLLLVVPLAGIGVVLLLGAWRDRGRGNSSRARLGWSLLSVPAAAAAAFVAVYPYLWPDPIGRTLTLFRFRAQEMAAQGDLWQDLAVASRAEALSRVGHWLGDQQSTTGWLAGTVAGWFGSSWRPSGIDLPLALLGALVFAGLVARHGIGSRHALAAAVLGGQVAAIVAGMRADFERYHLPILLVVAVCVGILTGTAWDAVSRLLPAWQLRRRARPSAAATVPGVASPVLAAVRLPTDDRGGAPTAPWPVAPTAGPSLGEPSPGRRRATVRAAGTPANVAASPAASLQRNDAGPLTGDAPA